MKTPHILSALCLAALLGVAASCDNIAESDRLVYVKPADVKKNILIEDFTGQTCRNCPETTDIIHQLQQTYGDSAVIAVGIYSGPFGKRTNGALLPLTTKDGDEYYTATGIQQQPSVFVDRLTITSDNSVLTTLVNSSISNEARALLSATPAYDAATGKASVKVSVESLSDVQNALFNVWVIEDSIVSPQIMPTGKTNTSYLHNHVFRTHLTAPMEGETTTLTKGQPVSRTYDVTVDASAWKADRLSYVIFVCDDLGVMQVIKTPVVPKKG